MAPFLPILPAIMGVSRDAQGDRCEGRHSSEVPRGRGALLVRRDVENALHQAGAAPGNLLELPPVLHGQTEAARYRRPDCPVHEEVRRADERNAQEGGRGDEVEENSQDNVCNFVKVLNRRDRRARRERLILCALGALSGFGLARSTGFRLQTSNFRLPTSDFEPIFLSIRVSLCWTAAVQPGRTPSTVSSD